MSLLQIIGEGMAGMYEIAFHTILIAGIVEVIK